MSKSLFDLVPAAGEDSLVTDISEVTASGESFAAEIIGSSEYRQSIKRRLQADSLAPAVELYFLQKLYGKNVEKREVTFPEGIPDYENMTPAQLEIEAEKLVRKFKAAKKLETTITATDADPDHETVM